MICLISLSDVSLRVAQLMNRPPTLIGGWWIYYGLSTVRFRATYLLGARPPLSPPFHGSGLEVGISEDFATEWCGVPFTMGASMRWYPVPAGSTRLYAPVMGVSMGWNPPLFRGWLIRALTVDCISPLAPHV